jgi:hypothetical protein
VGAILITVALFLLHLGVLAVTKITGRAHAITYFPSLLALAMLTGLRVPGSGGAAFSFSPSVPVGIVLFVLWIPVAVLYSNINRWERTAKSRLNPLQVLWTNSLKQYRDTATTLTNNSGLHSGCSMNHSAWSRDWKSKALYRHGAR